jgi:beta-N-acetylhexosaminidase
MKKYVIIISLFFILLFSFASIAAAEVKTNFDFLNFLESGGEYLMEYKLENMSLAEKVGQLFQVGFHSKTADQEIKDLIENYHIGGVIYFSRNLDSLQQTAFLSNTLQDLALNSGASLPLFISADQEGGAVTRIKGGTHFPGNMALGATADPELVRKTAAATAAELKSIGINVNLAPVLDVNNNAQNPVIGVRSFGGKAELVAELGRAYIAGLQSKDVTATAKHFPGHGDTDTDSHLDLPVINHPRQRLEKVELFPFKEAIAAGVDSIMTAHIYFPTIESEAGIPATLSKAVLTDLLRQELGFEGLIITDCMEMKAIANTFGTVEGAIKTIEAGSDTVLISHSYQKQKKSIEALIQAVKSGRISEKRIDESVKRIIKLKAKRINFAVVNQADPGAFDLNKHRQLAREIAEKSITLVKNEEVFPLKNIRNKKVTLISFKMGRASIAEENSGKEFILSDYLKRELKELNEITLNQNSTLTEIQRREIEKSDLVIVSTYDAVNNSYQIELAEELAENNDVFVLALRNPYDFMLVDKVQAFMTTYDYSPANQRAAADFILGKIEPEGQLPVEFE